VCDTAGLSWKTLLEIVGEDAALTSMPTVPV
jgi:hypothetical protein